MGQTKLFKKECEDFISIASQAQGMRFIARALDYCGINTPSFDRDINAMAFKEGKRDVGLWLLSLVQDMNGGEEKLLDANRYRNQIFMEADDDGKAGKGKR